MQILLFYTCPTKYTPNIASNLLITTTVTLIHPIIYLQFIYMSAALLFLFVFLTALQLELGFLLPNIVHN